MGAAAARGPPSRCRSLYLGVVALLRHADGGAASGFAPLVLLPVAWVALHGRAGSSARWSAARPSRSALPLLASAAPSTRPASGARAAVWVAIAALLGYAVQRLVGEIARQAAASRRDLDERLRAERRLSVEGEVTRVLGESATLDDALPRCLDALGHGLGARAALLWRPDPPAASCAARPPGRREPGCGERASSPRRARSGSSAAIELPGRVWAGGEPIDRRGPGRAATARARSPPRRDGLHGVLAVPIASEREVHGVIELVRTPGG